MHGAWRYAAKLPFNDVFDCGFDRHRKLFLTLRITHSHAQGVLYKIGPRIVSSSFSSQHNFKVACVVRVVRVRCFNYRDRRHGKLHSPCTERMTENSVVTPRAMSVQMKKKAPLLWATRPAPIPFPIM